MSSSSKREENEEKLLQSSRRGDLDTVLVSFNVFILAVYITGMASNNLKTNYHFLIYLTDLRFIWEKSQRK